MPPADFASFLERSLCAMARAAPGHYERLGAQLGSEGVRIAVDGRARVVRFARGAHQLEDGAAPAATDVRSDRPTILALADGELTLLEALRRERLCVRGRPDAVVRFDAALLAFLEGVVHCPGSAALLNEFRCAAGP